MSAPRARILSGDEELGPFPHVPAMGVPTRQRASWHMSLPNAAGEAQGVALGLGAPKFGCKCPGGDGGMDGKVPGGGAINYQVTDLINFVPGGFFFFLFPKNQRKQNIFLIK